MAKKKLTDKDKYELLDALCISHLSDEKSTYECVEIILDAGCNADDIIRECFNQKSNDASALLCMADACAEGLQAFAYVIIKCPTQKQMGLLEEFCAANDLEIIE